MKKKKKIYVSLPISGRPVEEVSSKIERLKYLLEGQDYEVVSPLEVYAGEDPQYEDHICYDLRAMLDCDAIYMCSGWRDSLGCTVEYNVAQAFRDKGRRSFTFKFEDLEALHVRAYLNRELFT